MKITIRNIKRILEKQDSKKLNLLLKDSYPHDFAMILQKLTIEQMRDLFCLMEDKKAAEIFSLLDIEIQIQLIEVLPRKKVIDIVTLMANDDRVDLLKNIKEERKELILRGIAQAERNEILNYSKYPEDTAGSIMTSEYTTIPPDMTVREAINHLREVAPEKETIYYSYVVDKDRKLLGFISLKDLILSKPDELVRDIMHKEVISAKASEHREDVARRIQKYDLIALPVTDDEGKLLGIITYDDAMDVITEEYTEDFQKFGAVSGRYDTNYLRTPVWVHFKNRVVWIVILAILGLFSGYVVSSFKDVLSSLIVLAFYMPMLADTGGNTGSQAATVIVRAIALGQISDKAKDIIKVLVKELIISLLLALVLGLLSFARVLFFTKDTMLPGGLTITKVALVIAIALSVQVITATVIGAMLPLLAAKLKKDPAVIASPALTTFVDITGLLIYFTTAKILLGL